MSPKEKYTSVLNKYPSFRDDSANGCWKYLQGRRKDDNAEGLWRVHDKLYDLNSYIDKHPGGRQWLIMSRGTDVTEAFETHHLSTKPSQVLAKFYVRDATGPRNYKFTFEENGFYKTLKRRVVEKLNTIDRKADQWKSKLALDINLAVLLVTSVFAFQAGFTLKGLLWSLIAGQCLGWSANLAHNFIHQADNWRMLTANLSFFNFRDFRVFHAMSHHMYPNTFSDLEVSMYEPNLKWIPYANKTKLGTFYAYVVWPVVYALMFMGTFVVRMYGTLWSETKVFYLDELLGFGLPVVMFVFGNASLSLATLAQILTFWAAFLIIGSFMYGLFAFNNGHHGPDLVHEGDEIDSLDFGIYQLHTIADRKEIGDELVKVLLYYGLHTLHHMFPTLDHSVLPKLQGALKETCKEFNIKYEETTIMQAMRDQFKQIDRKETIKLE